MMGIKRKISIIALSLLLIALLIPVCSYAAAEPASSEYESAAGYYGRAALASLPNSEALIYAYDKMCEGVEKSSAEIGVYDGENPITADELKVALDAYRRDRVEHFWLGNSYSIAYNSKTVVSVKPTYIMSGEALSAAKADFLSEADEILLGIKSDMSEFEKELYLHDALAERITYVDSSNAHNAYGAIVEGKAVCEGYAEALQYLLGRCGILSFIATGESNNPATGSPEGHAWNIVRIDGRFYHLDLTWNDQGERIYHAYFNLTESAITRDHKIDKTEYPLPVCNSNDAMYFAVRGGILPEGEPSVSEIAAMLKAGGLKASVYTEGDAESFISWYYDDIRSIANAADVTSSFSYGSAEK